MIAAKQELELRPALEPLDRVVAASEGLDPDALTFAFRPLWQLDAATAAMVLLQKARATQIYAGLNLWPAAATTRLVEAQLAEDGPYPNAGAVFAEGGAVPVEDGRAVADFPGVPTTLNDLYEYNPESAPLLRYNMSEFKRAASEFRAVADVDFFDVSFIAESLREDFGLQDQMEMRSCTMKMIRRLMELGVCPGDYDYAKNISFWPGEPDDLVRRIEAEWIAMGKTPDLEHPICWFGLRQLEDRE